MDHIEDDVVWLLRLTSELTASTLPLNERRTKAIQSLMNRTGADAGWWAWGQGVPGKSQVTPLAFIPMGFTPEQLALHIEAGLDPEMDTLYRSKVMPFLEHVPQHTHLWNELVSDEIWHASTLYKRYYAQSGFDRHVNSVRYFENDYFSNASFCRKVGRPPFSESERQLLDWAMAGMSIMHISSAEAVPPEVLSRLTARQRTVLLMLLGGQSRKSVANDLSISEHTVNEHVKQLYKNFAVNSVTELAAKFLQSRE